MGEVVFIDFGGQEPWLSTRELAEELGRSVKYVENLTKHGLPHKQHGRQKLYKASAARNFIGGADRKGIAHVG